MGRTLALARLGWVVVALLSLYFSGLLVDLSYQRVATLSFLPEAVQRRNVLDGLAQLGLNTDILATYVVATFIVQTVVYFAIGAAIFILRSHLRIAFVVSLFLVTYSVGRSLVVFPGSSDWGLPLGIVITVAYATFISLYMSWNGYFIPGWTRYLALAWVILMTLANLLPDSPLAIRHWQLVFNLVAIPFVVGTGVYSHVYRYRHASTQVERQQTKWAAFVAALVLLISMADFAVGVIDPTLNIGSAPGYRGVIYEMVSDAVQAFALILIPVAILISILRYRLWDIDLIINRTLVYVPLTGIVAGLYAATVALFQRVFLAITGQQSDAAVIVTTLIVASLFTPIKNGLQTFVDKRFKEAPNPAKSLNAFSDHLSSVLEVFHVERITSRALREAVRAFNASGGAIYLSMDQSSDEPPTLVHTFGAWNGENCALSVPIVWRPEPAQAQDSGHEKGLGSLQLGPRLGGTDYTEKDRELLQQNASLLAEIIALDRRVTGDR